MENIINRKELLYQIHTNSKTDFDNEVIDIDIPFNEIDLKRIYDLNFNNCIFKSQLVFQNINDEELSITINNCVFESNIEFKNCKILSLDITRLKQINNIKISNCAFDSIKFNSYEEELIGKIYIRGITIKKELDFSNLKLSKGQLTLNFKKKSDLKDKQHVTLFDNSIFEYVNFNICDFGKESNFDNLIITESGFFSDCEFKKNSFEGTDFGNNTSFNNCKFYSHSGFQGCTNLENTNLKISSCLFTSFPHFNNSEFNYLEISHTTFEKKVSFDSLKVNSLKINQVTFLQGAYFDDILINEIINCDRKNHKTRTSKSRESNRL